MIPQIPISAQASTIQTTLPTGEKADPKSIAAKVQGMFIEMMLKSMEESVDAEEGLFGKSSSSDIFRGLFREQLGKAMSDQLKSPFEKQLEKKLTDSLPTAAKPGATPGATPAATPAPAPAVIKPLRGGGHEGHEDHEDHEDQAAMPVSGVVTSPVGWRRDPINGDLKFHKGTDIAAAYGSEVKAVAGGVVVESGVKGGYGNAVVIETDDGRRMLYGHNHANLVSVGDRVERGALIAQVGSSGRSTGPHVHFEVME